MMALAGAPGTRDLPDPAPRRGGGRFACVREGDQRKARDLGAAVNSDSEPEGAEPPICIDIEVFEAVEARVEALADFKNRFEGRAIVGDTHHAAVGMTG